MIRPNKSCRVKGFLLSMTMNGPMQISQWPKECCLIFCAD